MRMAAFPEWAQVPVLLADLANSEGWTMKVTKAVCSVPCQADLQWADLEWADMEEVAVWRAWRTQRTSKVIDHNPARLLSRDTWLV
ncbi:MAG: hypothetical protein CMJ50_02380 [Planctomycetaceae bacterium]|nr:hypothetical protein [Planctomycetaceae bacterium]